MHPALFKTAVRRIRSLSAPVPDGSSDRDLLARFLATRDEQAFAELVTRHGPSVFGICRRILSDRHAAEDAFQATFLVLARRASAIRKTASVGAWLHGVAFRVANKLKARLARQPRPATVPDVVAEPSEDVTWREVRRVLDEEVHRLPVQLRLPVLLCYFEGKTRDEAAEALGCKVSTLRGRLEDGRQRLRTRLARRGIELSAALLAVSTADALAIEETLVAATVRAATGSAPTTIQSLARGIAMSDVATRVKLSAGALLLAVGLGTTVLVYRGEAGESPAPGTGAQDKQKTVSEAPPGEAKDRTPSNASKSEVVVPPPDVTALRKVHTTEDRWNEMLARLALAADRIWVVPSPTRDKPVPTPDEVLKGPPADRPTVSDLRLLPSNDPKEKFIVFLVADEAGKSVAEVKRLSGSLWYLHHDSDIAATIRRTLEPAEWGPEKDGLRMGLRLRSSTVPAQGQVVAEVTIRNAGNNDCKVMQHRYNIYDYWPGTRFYVTAPDGSKWVVQRPSGPMDEADYPKEVTLKPGEVYIHALRLDMVPAYQVPTTGDPSLSNLFITPGKYSIECRHAMIPVVGEAGWEAGMLSNAVALTLTKPDPKPGAWGKAVDGIRARVRVPDGPITAGGPLVFDLDLKNVGDKQRDIPAYSVLCDVDLDGVRYSYQEKYEIRGSPRTLKPGDEFSPFVTVGPEMWRKAQPKRGEPAGIAYALTPGKHKLAASFRVNETTRVNSPPVEFEVKADEWGEASGGIKARLRLAKSTFRAGEPLAFELDLKNTGDKTYEDGPIPFHCRIELDGAEYQYTAPLGYPTSIQAIKPGKEFIPYVKVKTDEWWMHSRTKPDGTTEAVRLVLLPGKHKMRVAYPLIAKDKVIPVSQLVEFEVAPDGAGKEVQGVRARLRPEKSKWKAGESPRLDIELMNAGPKTWAGPPTDRNCLLEVDGAWYENETGRGGNDKMKVLSKSTQWGKWFEVHADRPRDGGNSWVVLVPDDPIRPAPESQKLKLTPGKHAIRVAYYLTEYGANGQPLKGDASEIRIETNAVEIEISK